MICGEETRRDGGMDRGDIMDHMFEQLNIYINTCVCVCVCRATGDE